MLAEGPRTARAIATRAPISFAAWPAHKPPRTGGHRSREEAQDGPSFFLSFLWPEKVAGPPELARNSCKEIEPP